MILATSAAPPEVEPLRARFAEAFLSHVDRAAATAELRAACARRLGDPSQTPAERAAVRGLAATVRT